MMTILFTFIFIFELCAWWCCVYARVSGGQGMVSDVLIVELKKVERRPMWVLGTILGSLASEVHVFNY